MNTELYRSYRQVIGALIALRNTIYTLRLQRMPQHTPSNRTYDRTPTVVQNQRHVHIKWATHSRSRMRERDRSIYQIIQAHKDDLYERLSMSQHSDNDQQRFLVVLKMQMTGKKHRFLCTLNKDQQDLYIVTIFNDETNYRFNDVFQMNYTVK